MTSRIGAAHQDVASAATTFDLAGGIATHTGQRAATVAEEVDLALADLEVVLIDHVATIADDLRRRAADHAATLAGTDWQGASKEQASAADQHLVAEIDRVLDDAAAGVDACCASIRRRADAYRSTVDAEVRAAMLAADQRYAALADTSRRFLAALQHADATIRLPG